MAEVGVNILCHGGQDQCDGKRARNDGPAPVLTTNGIEERQGAERGEGSKERRHLKGSPGRAFVGHRSRQRSEAYRQESQGNDRPPPQDHRSHRADS